MLTGGKAERNFAERLKSLVDSSSKILDVGTSQRFAKELRPYEFMFEGKEYVASGYEPKTGFGVYNCDCHQDVERMTFPEGCFDAVICLEVLEHVRNPFQAVEEIRRVLRSNGMVFLTVPFLTSYHGKGSQSHTHESYPDFWRFTHEGLQRMFTGFQSVEVLPLDGPIEYRLKQLYLTRFLRFGPIRNLVDLIDRPQLGKATSRHLLCGVK